MTLIMIMKGCEFMNRNLGLYWAFGALFILVVSIVTVAIYYPVKWPTIFYLTWVISPGIVGGLVFYNMDKKEVWGK